MKFLKRLLVSPYLSFALLLTGFLGVLSCLRWVLTKNSNEILESVSEKAVNIAKDLFAWAEN